MEEEKKEIGKLPAGRLSLLAFCLSWFAVLCYWHRRVVVDDPWITFRYAQNLISGHGLVFNQGEPLEGYSNFLWVLVAALAEALNIEPLGFMRLLAFGLAALLFAGLCMGARNSTSQPPDPNDLGFTGLFPRSATAAILLAATYPFAVWAMGGLETTLYAATVLCFVVTLAGAAATGSMGLGLVTGAFLTIASLTRPEAPMLLAILALAVVIAPRQHRRALLTGAALWLCLYAVYTVWRWHYFGTPIPNTVSAKVGGETAGRLWRGFVYTAKFLFGPPGLLLLLGFWSVARLKFPWHKNASPQLRLLAVLALATVALQTAFAFAVGGDWMPAARFFVPIIPVLCLLAAMAIRPWPFFVRWTLVMFIVLGNVISAWRDPELRWYRWAAREQGGGLVVQPLIEAGVWLRKNAAPGALVASSEAGVVPYYSELPYIDMLGLVDKHIAALPGDLHEQYDADYVLSREPEYILLQLENRDGAMQPAWPSDRQVFENAGFMENYGEVTRFPRLLTGERLPQLREGALVVYRRGALPPPEPDEIQLPETTSN